MAVAVLYVRFCFPSVLGFFCCCPYLSWCSPRPLLPQVVANLKDAFFSRLDDAQSRVNDEMDRAVDRWGNLLQLSWRLLAKAQDSSTGRVITAGLDELLTQSEAAVAYYLPLPPTLRKNVWHGLIQALTGQGDTFVAWNNHKINIKRNGKHYLTTRGRKCSSVLLVVWHISLQFQPEGIK